MKFSMDFCRLLGHARSGSGRRKQQQRRQPGKRWVLLLQWLDFIAKPLCR